MQPLKTHVVLDFNSEDSGIVAHVDPDYADWQQNANVVAYLRHLSERMLVVVVVDDQAYRVMPSCIVRIEDEHRKNWILDDRSPSEPWPAGRSGNQPAS
jgi:hypothetical protein